MNILSQSLNIQNLPIPQQFRVKLPIIRNITAICKHYEWCYRNRSFYLQILPLENEMKKPKVFMRRFGVLNIGMGTIVFLYTALGFFGYIRYGSAIEGSITLSLNEPLLLAKSVQILLAIAIFFTHPIQCYVAIDIAWNEYIAPNFEKNSHKVLWEYVVRTSLVLLTCKWTSLSSLSPNVWRQFRPGRTILLI